MPPIQKKLGAGGAGHEYEREADRVAESVMRMPDSDVNGTTMLRDRAPLVQSRVAGGNGTVGDAPAVVHDVLASPGRPLDAETRAFFDPRFEYDFGDVRVHSDSAAGQSARALNAKAYTVGSDVVFAEGRFAPETRDGKSLLAHELTHVVQQQGGSSSAIQMTEDEPLSLLAAGAQGATKSVNQLDKAVLDLLALNPSMTVQDAIRQAVGVDAAAAPSLIERGDASPISGFKRALVVYNVYYEHDEDLEEVAELGPKMAASLEAREYDVQVFSNLTGSELVTRMQSFLDSAMPGEDTVIYYSGHGELGGIKGVDEVTVAPEQMYELREKARLSSSDLTVILEACHTGSTTDFIRSEDAHMFAVRGLAEGNTLLFRLASVAIGLQDIKNELTFLEFQRGLVLDPPDGAVQDNAEEEYYRKFDEIVEIWAARVIEVELMIHEVEGITGSSLTHPGREIERVTGPSPTFVTSKLDEMDTLINEIMKLAELEATKGK